MNDIYERLREQLDNLFTGYPATESEVEIKILKRLFSEEDAELFLQLSPKLEKPVDIAKRISRDPHEVADHLFQMSKRGLLFRMKKSDSIQYSARPFIGGGIIESQVNTIYKELADDLENYFYSGFGKSIQGNNTPVFRTIPINKELAAKSPIAPFDDAVEILRKQKSIQVSNCSCRVVGRLVDKGCTKPLETCFWFGALADFYVENRLGRYVDAEEAVEIVRKNLQEAPFVIQVSNMQKGGALCMCCGDCCVMLRSAKMQPKPAQAVKSNYYARINEATCTGCKTCIKRCQMDAIDIVGGKVKINYDRCIGCGSCVITCPTESRELLKKQNDQIYTPPENGMVTFMEIMKERGKI